MKQKILLFLLLCNALATAQVTAIPDPAFEQELINLNIDSEGTLNGQVLTSDIENVTELSIISNMSLTDITGIENFTNLQDLTIMYTQLMHLDVSQNLQLKRLICQSNMLTDIDVSLNVLLEEINVGNELDLGPWNMITEVDLSNNPNIKLVNTLNMPECELINLRNLNNNPDLTMIIGITPWNTDPNDVYTTVCIEVDNEAAAQANEFPYSEWTIYYPHAAYNFAENCALSTSQFEVDKALSLYPNPASGVLHLAVQGKAIEKVELYDTSGRLVREYNNISESAISLTGVATGTYILKALTQSGILNAKVVVQ